MPVNWFDIALGVMILLSAIAGFRSGFARVIIGLIATVVGLLAGFWCYRLVGAKLLPYLKSAEVADIFGFFIIFFGIVLVGSLLATLFARLFRWIGLSWFDHFLGGLAGFVRGILLVAGTAAILVAFAPSPTPAFLTQSQVMPYATAVAGALAETAPRELKDAFEQQWANLKQFWAEHRQTRRS